MKFVRIGEVGAEKPYLLDDEGYWSLESITADIDGDFLANDGIAKAIAAKNAGDLTKADDLDTARIGSPIARPPAVICVGMNYAAHAAESGATPPAQPVIFFKHPNTVVGPNDDVAIPRNSDKTDWEVELGIVISKKASYLNSPEDAPNHIAGYVLVNDLSERTFQIDHSGGQWSKGKSAAGFSPTGPWLVPATEIDAGNLDLKSWINGEVRQDSNSSDMIFDVNFIVYHLSQYMELEPGDLILTGTPEGVGLSGRFPYLTQGDVVEIEITNLGRQKNNMV